MFRSDLQWYFPETVEEAAALLRDREVVAHGGGTGLLRARSSGWRALVDLGRLPLRERVVESGWIRLGALSTFSDLIGAGAPGGQASAAGSTLDLLAEALRGAASTPLRHRITLGGSVADSPPWSDLAPALLALGAEIDLLQADGGARRLPYEAYLAARGGRGVRATGVAGLVREVRIPEVPVLVFHLARLTRVRFDYAPCHVALAARPEGGRLREVRLFVTGTRGYFTRLTELERELEGRAPAEAEAAAAERLESLELPFAADLRFSARYKNRWTRVQVLDGLRRMKEEAV